MIKECDFHNEEEARRIAFINDKTADDDYKALTDHLECDERAFYAEMFAPE